MKLNQTNSISTSMFSVRCWMLNVAVLATAASALADVHYVDVNSTNATPPYSSWATAATNIQDAVDAAVAGDDVVVTNGIYVSGGRSDGFTVNRVAVDKAISLRSVNGPQSTIIDGGGVFRCVYLTNGASLSGFTLTGGRAVSGGGLYCESTNAVVSNCVVSGNVAEPGRYGDAYGGGAAGGTLNNCTLSGNYAYPSIRPLGDLVRGGGAYGCMLNNCTLSYNSAYADGGFDAYSQGGGAYGCTLNNCTLSYNSAYSDRSYDVYIQGGGGAYRCTLNNCTLTSNEAEYFGGGAAFCALNNCIAYFNTGGNYAGCTLSYCCTMPQPSNGVGNITGAPLFVGNLRLQSNSPCINAGNNFYVTSATDLDGNPRIVGGTVDIGAYEFQSLDLIGFGVVSNRFGFNITGQSNWVIVLEATSDFTSWTPLTTNTLNGHPFPLPRSHSAKSPAALLPRANGLNDMKTIAKLLAPLLLLACAASVLADVHYVDVNSTNATPPYTNWSTAATNIQDAVDAAVAGDEIVVTNGIYAPVSVPVDKPLNVRSVNGSQFTTIDAHFSGSCASGASLSGFTLTGGFSDYGGGAYGGTLTNCTLTDNVAEYEGGGAYGCRLNNCTLTGNGGFGAAVDYCHLWNCIIYFNSARNHEHSELNFCCTDPFPYGNGYGNITTSPLFVDRASGNLRLQSNSPCINAGNNSYVTSATDLDGNPRIVGSAVDIGAYEYQSLDLVNFGVVSNRFGFNITGQSNWVIVLETTSDFTSWTPLTTNTLNGNPFSFRDPTPPNLPQRFYRARME